MESNPAVPAPYRYMRMPEVCAYLGGLTPQTVRRLVKQGELPQPRRINGRSWPMWRSDEIDGAMTLSGVEPVKVSPNLTPGPKRGRPGTP